MTIKREKPIPGRADSGKIAAVELSFQWVSQEGPPLVDLYISKLGNRFWGESWHLLPDEAERLAQLLDEATQAVSRREPELVGQFVHADRPAGGSTAPWLTVSVMPAPYLETRALRVRLAFDDEMVAERPDAASLWFTTAASRRVARGLRQTVARASSDKDARQEAQETVVSLHHACTALIPGHLLSVTGVGLRGDRINVYWLLTPLVPEDELSKVLAAVKCSAVDDLGNEYPPSGFGYSSGRENGEAVTRGLFALRPGPRPGATLLRVVLRPASRSLDDEWCRLDVNLKLLGTGTNPA